MRKYEDLTGQTFGTLAVVRPIRDDKGVLKWECKCSCGKTTNVLLNDLKRGMVKSCGCTRFKHRQRLCSTKRPELVDAIATKRLRGILNGMIQRCENKNRKAYAAYGGKGIKVCPEWRNDFWSFYNWAMNNGYEEKLTIDRIDGQGDYCPENCRWATMVQQNNNRKDNRRITYNGETHTISEWSRLTGINKGTIKDRLNAGWPDNEALGDPHKRRPHKSVSATWFNKKTIAYKDGVLIGMFSSRTEAAEHCGLDPKEVSDCVVGRRKAIRGYTFKRYEEVAT